jgi:tetrachlorobenzoquinone reductase
MTVAVSPPTTAPGSTASLIDVRVTAIRPAADDTNLYELVRPDGAPLPAEDPGADNDINLSNGITRQNSLVIPQPPNPRSWLDL